MKGMVYQSCARLVILYGSETWCLRENEMAILRAMVRAMCGATDGEKEGRGPNGNVGIEGKWFR